MKSFVVKPPHGARINYGHPLAQGVGGLWLFEQTGVQAVFNGPVNHVNNQAIYNSGGPANAANGKEHYGYVLGNVTAYLNGSTAAPQSALVPAARCTVCFIRKKLDTGINGTQLIVNNTVGSSTLSFYAPYLDGTCYWDFGGTSGNNRLTWAGYTPSTDYERWTLTAGRTGMRIYFNGVLQASQAVAAVSRVAATTDYMMLSAGANSQEIFMLGVFEAEWSASDVAYWAANPYCFLQPSMKSRMFGVTAAGGAIWAPSLPLLGIG